MIILLYMIECNVKKTYVVNSKNSFTVYLNNIYKFKAITILYIDTYYKT